jgi:hypothetical protein
MGRWEFRQPRRFSGEGDQTDPAKRGAVRPAWLGGQTGHPRNLGGVVFEVASRVVSVLEVMVLMVGMVSLQVVSLLDVLPLVLNTGMGGVVALSWRAGTVHDLPFMVFVLLQLERVGSLIVVTLVVFVEVASVGDMFCIVLTPLLSKWLGTGLLF